MAHQRDGADSGTQGSGAGALQFRIEGFTDLTPIGSGGFGHVYRAHQTALDRAVAIKVLVLAAMDDRTRVRFDRERRTMGALSVHPAIVTLYESGITGEGFPYLVMELMRGGSMADRVETAGPLPWPEAARIAARISDAVHHAHAAGVLHRDIKPENVLISEFGEAKLTDFGIAALLDATATATSNLTTTVEHAAPEILDGLKPTPATDVYSLGSTLFAFLTGHSPFRREDNDSLVALLARIATEPVPDLRRRGLPEGAAGIVEAALEKDPSRRIASAAELAARLREAAGGETPVLAATAAAASRPPPTEAAPSPSLAGEAPPPAPAVTVSAVPAKPPPPQSASAAVVPGPGAVVRGKGLWFLGVLALAAPFLGWLGAFGSPPGYWGGAFDINWSVVWTGRILATAWWASWGVPVSILAVITVWVLAKRPRMIRPIGMAWLALAGAFAWVVATNSELLISDVGEIGFILNLPTGAWVATSVGLVLIAAARPTAAAVTAVAGLAVGGTLTYISQVRVAWLFDSRSFYAGWWQSLGAVAAAIGVLMLIALLRRAAGTMHVAAYLAAGLGLLYAGRMAFELSRTFDVGEVSRMVLLDRGVVLMLTAGLLALAAGVAMRSRSPA